MRSQAGVDTPPLPQVVRIAWGLGEPTNRGPKPKHTAQDILATAIRLADEGGLDGLSMAALAGPLGLTPTALYRYVDSKETLIELMVDFALGSPPSPDSSREWGANAAVWARALMEVYARHPWLSDVIVTGMPRTPHSFGWMESLLESLAESSLQQRERLSAALLLQGVVRTYAAMIRSTGGSPGASGALDPSVAALAEDSYPRTIAELRRPRDSVFDEFGFALDTTIRGLGDPR